MSDERRTQQTAAPLIERLHRAPVVFASAAATATADRLLREHGGGTVLVIAGGASFPALLRTLGDREVRTPAPEEAGVMYLLSIPTFGPRTWCASNCNASPQPTGSRRLPPALSATAR